MRIEKFQIKNFKGISECTLDLEQSGAGRMITLIGLNESGKTTILEALSNFVSEDEDLSSLVGTRRPEGYTRSFVPKDKKANFTGNIELRAFVEFEEGEKSGLAEFFKKQHTLILEDGSLPDKFWVAKVFRFKNSEPEGSNNTWDIRFKLKTKTQKNFRIYSSDPETRDVWLSAIRFLGERIPRICYFPTFLFEVPEKIYLEEIDDEDDASAYYRQLLQDVLDFQGEGLTLKEHVVDRIQRERAAFGNPVGFFAKLLGLDSKEMIDSVFRKMSSELSKVIFGAWNEIFKHRPKNKYISVEWGVDSDNGNAPYAQFFIVDGESKYALSERSLGFRWFFCFLLFTRFRASRREGGKTYFLFDEPASNLHPKAQLQLLDGFSNIAGDRNLIIYSTHSHHMIEPLWLDRGYIVANHAIDYDSKSDALDYFSTRPTKIVADRYRNFVGQNPDKATYFQPVLDRLDYVVPPIIGDKNALIVEGKQDFSAMKYFFGPMGANGFDVIPGTGSGNMSTIVSLCIGWGRKFIILLDDDGAGQKERDRYKEEYLLEDDEVITFGDIAPELKGKKLEQLFDPDFKNLVRTELALNRVPSKKDCALFFQQRLATGRHLDLDDIDEKTQRNMRLVAEFVQKQLA